MPETEAEKQLKLEWEHKLRILSSQVPAFVDGKIQWMSSESARVHEEMEKVKRMYPEYYGANAETPSFVPNFSPTSRSSSSTRTTVTKNSWSFRREVDRFFGTVGPANDFAEMMYWSTERMATSSILGKQSPNLRRSVAYYAFSPSFQRRYALTESRGTKLFLLERVTAVGFEFGNSDPDWAKLLIDTGIEYGLTKLNPPLTILLLGAEAYTGVDVSDWLATEFLRYIREQ